MSFGSLTTSKKRSGNSAKRLKNLSPVNEVAPVEWDPSEQQLNSAKFMVERPAAGILHPPGKGKTSITYFAFKTLRDAGVVKTMLVISNRRIIYDAWPRENKKWIGLGFRTATLHGPKKVEALLSDADVYFINYEGLAWLEETCKLHKIKIKDKFDMAVADESTALKNWKIKKVKRAQIVKRLAPQFKRRYILNGSPVPRTLLDIYGQIWFLDLGHTLGNKGQFLNQYFYPSGYEGYDWKPEQGAYERVFEKLKDLVIRYEKDDDDPEIVPVIREVELPKEARKIYDEMEEELFTYIQGKPVESVNGAVAYGKCRQIANGGLYLEKAGKGTTKKRKWAKVHDEKTEELKNLIDELNGMPALIAYEFNHDLERLQEAFPNIPYIGKGVSDAKAEKLIADWNAGKLPMLAAHPGSAAKGLNLQGVESAVVFYAISNNFDWVDQFIKRIARKGQSATHIFVYFFIAKNTVDEVVKAGLEAKEFNQDVFNGFFSRYYEDEATKETNQSKAGVKQIFSLIESAFEDVAQELPPYAPDMDIEFLQFYETAFYKWSKADLLGFCDYLDIEVKKSTTIKVDKLRDMCLEYICKLFGASKEQGWKLTRADVLKLYPNVKTKKEVQEMAFGASKKKSKRERVPPRSKFSPGGEVEANRKALEELEESKAAPNKKTRTPKKHKSMFDDLPDQKDDGTLEDYPDNGKGVNAPHMKKERKAARERVAKKAPVKKAPTKKAPVKKAPTKKAPVKKTVAKKKSGGGFGSRNRRG